MRMSRELAIAGMLALSFVWAGMTTARAQAPPAYFPNVVSAVKATPGCLGAETGQTSSGKRVIFAWFESKKALVGWYRSDVHQRAMKAVFPNQTFDREPLPDLAEDSGPILARCRAVWRWAEDLLPNPSRCAGCARSTWGRRKLTRADNPAGLALDRA